ncbi:succinate dehydrogenase cytochrome b subunit [Roseibacillus persicicus]|uniref:Succinate dehydrogenase n=1 Tax=Roseibacillus persicicus TaxID=454148 RepID=A0A918TIM3_9BACT|nr:succinate dehydrogenase cytochrome b subunit [Roseibacillus persicicus]MDQ8190001.1 succinate dehydrogenase cytochrome b subunit [Roseibacillus persicicus]GHC50858.1 succinate dehydrogenase [Roseibacillus persicicus]
MTALTQSVRSLWDSSIGKKTVVAVTGLVFIGFLVAHLIGNLLVFVGEEAFNHYAEWLHGLGHGAAVWVARLVLLGSLVLHVVATVSLTRQNRAARIAYAHEDTLRASKSSKIMIWSGLTVLAFIIFHILHFTVRTDAQLAKIAAESPYQMVIVGFQNWLVVIFYAISMTLLCSHLSHGFSSAFQTLGFSSSKTRSLLDKLGKAYSLLILVGFLSIPISIRIFGYGS